jgi:hypothetical protein
VFFPKSWRMTLSVAAIAGLVLVTTACIPGGSHYLDVPLTFTVGDGLDPVIEWDGRPIDWLLVTDETIDTDVDTGACAEGRIFSVESIAPGSDTIASPYTLGDIPAGSESGACGAGFQLIAGDTYTIDLGRSTPYGGIAAMGEQTFVAAE